MDVTLRMDQWIAFTVPSSLKGVITQLDLQCTVPNRVGSGVCSKCNQPYGDVIGKSKNKFIKTHWLPHGH